MIDHADNVIDLNAILHPGSVYDHPRRRHPGSNDIDQREASDPRILGVGRGQRCLEPGAQRTTRLAENHNHRRDSGSTLRLGPPPEGASGRQAGTQEIDLTNRPRSLGARPIKWIATMIDDKLALMRAHRTNINRYQRLLKTKLTEFERQFIERRLSEEQSAIEKLAGSTFPISFQSPIGAVRKAATPETASSYG